MKKQFKCTLQSDIIINQKAATEETQETLDFIPGNNFLGVVAGVLYNNDQLSKDEQWVLFHSGKVRFGDAHPCDSRLLRSLRVPAAMAHPKNDSYTYIIYHEACQTEKAKNLQLKQNREGFYLFDHVAYEKQGEKLKVNKSFAIKSAYDSEKRRSKDKQMYGYQSLDKGASFLFEVDIDDDIPEALTRQLIEALQGEGKRVGRSRTAQYGLVNIEEVSYKEFEQQLMDDEYVYVYADGRLIFLDKDTGLPTFRPTAAQLGVQGGEIDWCKTQIRTFQYAPWNFKRQACDTDRCGIEKGSVFAIKNGKVPSYTAYIGSYRNEGFGKVIYNPAFLEADNEGKALWALFDPEKGESEKMKNEQNQEPLFEYIEEEAPDELINYLYNCYNEDVLKDKVYKAVNEFVSKNKNNYKGERFASQWGRIRQIGMQYTTKEDLKRELFDENNGYLTHGVAAEKWSERNRFSDLEKFVGAITQRTDGTKETEETEKTKKIKDKEARWRLINLASAMAKECKTKESE